MSGASIFRAGTANGHKTVAMKTIVGDKPRSRAYKLLLLMFLFLPLGVPAC